MRMATGDCVYTFWLTSSVCPSWSATSLPFAPSAYISVECVRRITWKFRPLQTGLAQFRRALRFQRPQSIFISLRFGAWQMNLLRAAG